MASEEELKEYAEDIRKVRQLPYTLIVEKVEDDLYFTHNQWGNEVVYRKEEKDYVPLTEEELEKI